MKREEEERLASDVKLACADQLSCERAKPQESKEEEFIPEEEYVCSGEWGCVDVDKGIYDRKATDCDVEFATKAIFGVTPDVRMLNNSCNNGTRLPEENDVFEQIMETMMSDQMAPLTLSVLILNGILMLIGMWCLCQRGTCNR